MHFLRDEELAALEVVANELIDGSRADPYTFTTGPSEVRLALADVGTWSEGVLLDVTGR